MDPQPSAIRLHERARRVLPGGVCAAARANPALGHPLYLARGEGAYVHDTEGRAYVDLCTSHGASLLGHGHPRIRAAVLQALEMGVLCSAETEHQVRLAERLVDLVPCAEMVRFGGSGTETVMHGLRLARCATGREKVVKFEGHFHGYADALNHSVMPPLAHAGPAHAPLAWPESGGMPRASADALIVLPFNDCAALEAAFDAHGPQIAALLVEPINYDQGCIPAAPGFLERCRALCDCWGTVLFFDEVLTAFRTSAGCAQHTLGVTPDLCVLGKALGAGVPISALCGRRAVMEHLKPLGDSQMSGTYLAHLTGVLAAQAAVEVYATPGFYEGLEALTARFHAGLREVVAASGVRLHVQHAGPRLGFYFGVEGPVTHYREAALRNGEAELRFIRACLDHGVYWLPAAHHGYSAVHTHADLDRVLVASEAALALVRREMPGLASR